MTHASPRLLKKADPTRAHYFNLKPYLAENFTHPAYSKRTVNAILGGKMEPVTIDAPDNWGDGAVATVVEKYLRRADVPSETVEDPDSPAHIPPALRPRIPAPGATFGPETSIYQVLHRLAGAWAYHAILMGYLTPEDALVLYEEALLSLELQMASPNSPQWFNVGLAWAYGIKGQGHTLYRADPDNNHAAQLCQDAYTYPQASACFILDVKDDLVRQGGIMDLWCQEAGIFKGGSGAGVNVSPIRAEGECLSGGGVSSGVMGFLRIGDRAAGAIKSGGRTRRAAKMLCMDADHPDILAFVGLKAREEHKVAALSLGSHKNRAAVQAIHDAITAHGHPSPQSRAALDDARIQGIPSGLVTQAVLAAQQGFCLLPDAMGTDWRSEAYYTVDGQNANNTVRLPHAFMRAVQDGGTWRLKGRVDECVSRDIPARDLWDATNTAAWASADPGLHFSGTIDEWHTCPEDGPITASNPCSEYLFVNNTACNLASLNLLKCLRRLINGLRVVDAALLQHLARLWTLILDITVGMAGYPTAMLAINSARYRTLGLGMANLGALLMQSGFPYGSSEGLVLGRALAAIINATAYQTSAHLAAALGPHDAYEANRAHSLRVLRNHRAAVVRDLRAGWDALRVDDLLNSLGIHDFIGAGEYEGLTVTPPTMHTTHAPTLNLCEVALKIYARAYDSASIHGLRNAQLTVCAPTGTISFQMGCDTTGCEPEFALVRTKTYAGGGSRNLVNQSVGAALEVLGWCQADITAAVQMIEARGAFFHDDPFPEGHKSDLEADDLYRAARVLACACAADERVVTLAWTDHVAMLAALQPHISGALSKTINLPQTATRADIAEAYSLSYRMGLKAVAVYRDGSKLSQPLNLPDLAPTPTPAPQAEPNPKFEREYMGVARAEPRTDSPTQAVRMSLPALAESVRVKATLAGRSFYLHTGEYADGRLGEVFVTMGGQGGDLGAWIGAWAQSVSVALQHGTPFDALARSFLGHQANPSGFVHGLSDVPQLAHIRSASSPMDLIFQVLGAFYDDNGMRRDREPALPSGFNLWIAKMQTHEWPLAATHEGRLAQYVQVLEQAKQPRPKSDAQEPSLLPDLLLWVEKMQMPPHERPPALTREERLAQYAPQVLEQAKQLRPIKPKGGGDLCPNCNHFGLRQSGACKVCDVCHTTTGCS